MAKYKNIKSAIHNWAHSFLSIENYDEKGYFLKELYEAAKSENAEQITINVLSEQITPESVKTDRVETFLKRCRESFNKQLQSQSVNPEMVTEAILKLNYNFSAPLASLVGFSFRDPWKAPEAATYTTEIMAVDNRGSKHHAMLQEWWR
jgi:alpha-amylase/alpha-mannosidase (GH57 family)